ncbi:MAG: NmrA family NAD(P)-binding protein [Cytophagales bacterium]|nr:NmrA family NAD(P)-binding protein [Cytophagales bacterium]
MSTILVFNATGMQGLTIANRLKAGGHHIVTPVRTEEKAISMEEHGFEAFVSDFKRGTLVTRISQVDQVVLQIPAQIAPFEMVEIANQALSAIKEAGSPKTVFVISSTFPDHKVGKASVDARVKMKELSLELLPEAPILSGTEYLENFSTAYRGAIEGTGTIPQTIPPEYPVNYLSWSDLAIYVEAALKSTRLEGKLYRIGGKEGINGNELARRLGLILGKELKYIAITHEQLHGFLTPILGESVAHDYAEFYEYQDTVGQDLLNPDTEEIRSLLDIQLPDFEEWAKEAFKDRL